MNNNTAKPLTFSAPQILETVSGKTPSTNASIYRHINKLIKNGTITRINRNTYCFADSRYKTYTHEYSDFAKEVASSIQSSYTDVNFTVFETRQLNEFMNLQVGKNAIILSVESGLENYIFQELFQRYPGKVLLKPDTETMWTYLQEDSIIINKLPTEAPVSAIEEKWMTCPEKFLVDLAADKILKALITSSQIEYIYEGYLNHYQIDTKKMLRYARRRACEETLKLYIEQYKGI